MIHTHTSRFVLSLIGLFALVTTAEAQRPSSSRPAGGGGGGGGGRPSAPSVSRPSAPSVSRPSVSRPSAPSVSRPSAPSVSRPSAPQVTRTTSPTVSRPTYQRPSVPQAPPVSQPRYEQPSVPRYEAPSTPRYEQPSVPRYSAPATPRYEAPTGSPYDAPAGRSTPYDGGAGPSSRDRGNAPSGSDRSAPTPYGGSRDDAAGRIYEGGRESTGPSGRIEPARIDRSSPTPYQPRVWQPDAPVDLSGAVRSPRIGVPSISGSRSGPDGGLSSGRLSRAGVDAARPSAAVPHPEVSADALRARYGAATPDSKSAAEDVGRTSDGTKRAGGLSTARTRSDAVTRTKTNSASSRTDSRGGRKGDDGAKNGSRGSSTNRRVADSVRSVGDLQATSPAEGGRVRAASRAAHAAGTIAGGIVIGGGSGGYDGGCWDPDASHWGGYGYYWNSCWTGGWWWSFSFGWPYGSCWWYRPYYYNSYWPYGYGYSSWGWCVSPYAYTSVIYVDSEPDVVYVDRPVEAPVAEPIQGAQGAVPKVAPEIKEGLEKSADEALAAGDTAFREGRYSDAVRHYARAVEFSPERGSLWLILSDALFATGDYHYAAYAFRRSIELDATLLETLVDKHGWYADPAEFDRHIAWAEAYLRDHVLDEDARLILAANYLFAKRYASASDALESAFGAGLVETPAGRAVLERSRRALGIAPK